jgi:hypothetical protein
LSRYDRHVYCDRHVYWTHLFFFGLVIGVPGFWYLRRAAASLVFELSRGDPLHLVTAAVALAPADAIGAFIPARHASRLDPINTWCDE